MTAIVFALAAIGAFVEIEDEPADRINGREQRKAEREAAKSTPTVRATPSAKPEPAADEVDLKSLETEIAQGFSTTTWFPLIKSYESNGGSINVRTSIFPDAEGAETARLICAVVIHTDIGQEVGNVVVRGRGSSIPAFCYLDGDVPVYEKNF